MKCTNALKIPGRKDQGEVLILQQSRIQTNKQMFDISA